MDLPIKLVKDFETCWDQMKIKYGEDFEILNGLHISQLNFSDFIDGFVDKNVADATIDSNANASTKDIRSLLSEKGKANDKLTAFNKIFYELKKKYGLKTAREWLETEYSGGFYLHDASTSTFVPYCYAYDLTRLATEGLFFLNHYNNEPPRHLTTFIDDVIEFVSFMSNRTSGAVGIPNVLIWSYYFWKKDCEDNYCIKDPDYYIRQSFQKLIYRLNQPFMRVDQSSFVNVSIFDRYYIESLFGGVEYPDGSFVIDNVEELIEHQKIFMEVVSDIRHKNMFTFPVLTYSLLVRDDLTDEDRERMMKSKEFDIFKDKEFARWCSDHNTEWNDSNFFMSDNVSSLSNCPVSGDTKVLVYIDSQRQYRNLQIRSLYDMIKKDPKLANDIKVISNGNEAYAKVLKFHKPIEYEIILENGLSLKTTSDHLNKVKSEDNSNIYKPSKDLTTDDYLPLDKKIIDGKEYLSYDEGLIIGTFLKGGLFYPNNSIIFPLINDDIYDRLLDTLEIKYADSVIENYELGEFRVENCPSLVDFINKYIKITPLGVESDNIDISLNLENVNSNPEFAKGILDSISDYLGDEKDYMLFRISSYSNKFTKDLIDIIVNLDLGIELSNYSKENEDGSIDYVIDYKLSDKYYSFENCYTPIRYYEWSKIKEIKRLDGKDKVSYCIFVLGDGVVEPVFTLSNGIITHNCRLVSDTSKLSAFINSIGGTALSIGSIKVNTINLMRIAIESKLDEEKYLDILRSRTTLCCKTLDIVRSIISRNIEKGLLPNYQDGAVEMDKQYCTIGILGLYEVIKYFGYINIDEFGNASYTDKGVEFACKIFDILNDVKDTFPANYSFNIESVPAERAAVILCQKDNLLYDRDEEFIYSNQWIPLSQKCTIQEKLRTSSIFDNKCSGGAIAHINLESNFPNKDTAWEMLNKIALSKVIYFAFNTRINECENHHGFVGTDICPECGKPVYDTYQRIVGYLVPRRSYSKDRMREFDSRRWYQYSEMLND